MEINLIETSRNVSEYLRKSDLRYREQFTEDRAEFEESKTCGNMGALRMAEICENLQEVGHSGDLSRASVLIEQLEAGFGRVRQALEAELSKEKS
jgi:hypothetical protein